MERVKKMVLVSKDHLDRIRRGGSGDYMSLLTPHTTSVSHDSQPFEQPQPQPLQSTQTIGDNLARLDDELKKILDSSTNYQNDHERLKDYMRVLQRYLFFTEEKRRPVEAKSELESSPGLEDELIINSVPKGCQKNAKLLLSHLRSKKDRIYWNQSGVVFIDGTQIPGSNIIDLINDACRKRKNIRAEGRQEFAAVLREIHTPREFVGNPEFWNIESSSQRLSFQQETSQVEADNRTFEDGDESSLLEDSFRSNPSPNLSGKIRNIFPPRKLRKSKKKDALVYSTPMKWLQQN